MEVNCSQTFFDVHKVEEQCTCTKRGLHILSGESWGWINLMHGRSTLGYKKLIWLDDTVKDSLITVTLVHMLLWQLSATWMC